MKTPYVDSFVPNEIVTGLFLVLSKEIRQKKTGEPYLSLHLADRTGEVEAKMWDNVAEVMETFGRDDFVKVKGLAQVYQNRTQFTIHRLRRMDDAEVDFADYFPCSEQDPEQMFGELQQAVDAMANRHLRELLTLILADNALMARYKIAPAAKQIHHACRGGLLEHVLSLVRLSRTVSQHYKTVDLDLLTAGAILHDIGKVEELNYDRSFGYTSEGQLLGHIIIGLRIVGEKLAALPDFPPRLRTLLEHMIVSHHGELEFGSPKVPLFAEALLLHHLDNLDSKMEAMKNAIRRDSQVEGEFTGWISSLERSLLRKDRYLAGSKPAPAAASPAIPSPAAHSPSTLPEVPPSAPPIAPPALSRERQEHRPAAPTLFGEKLQAVLETRK